jgi:hypothetical protein
MHLVNLTPHAIVVLRTQAEPVTLLPGPGLAHCAYSTECVKTIDGIPITRQTYGQVTGLPAPQKGVAYVVSRMVAEAVRASGDLRDDLYVTGPLSTGHIACDQLSVV